MSRSHPSGMQRRNTIAEGLGSPRFDPHFSRMLRLPGTERLTEQARQTMSSTSFGLVCVPFGGSRATFYRSWSEELWHSGTATPTNGAGGAIRRRSVHRRPRSGRQPRIQARRTHRDRRSLRDFRAQPWRRAGLRDRARAGAIGAPSSHTCMQVGLRVPGTDARSGRPGLGDDEFLARVQDFAGYRHPRSTMRNCGTCCCQHCAHARTNPPMTSRFGHPSRRLAARTIPSSRLLTSGSGSTRRPASSATSSFLEVTCI